MDRTIEYYNKNSQNLCEKYDSVDLSILHKDLLNFFKNKKSLLEIGTGSGRDMNFMVDSGFDVIGIDGSEEMIKNSNINYPKLVGKTILAELPDKLPSFDTKFDGLFAIATLMHFSINELNILLKKLIDLLYPNSPVFISVSGYRDNKNSDRFFLELSKSEWIKVFEKNSFKVIGVKENQDYTGRNINWYSFFLKTKL